MKLSPNQTQEILRLGKLAFAGNVSLGFIGIPAELARPDQERAFWDFWVEESEQLSRRWMRTLSGAAAEAAASPQSPDGPLELVVAALQAFVRHEAKLFAAYAPWTRFARVTVKFHNGEGVGVTFVQPEPPQPEPFHRPFNQAPCIN